MSKLLRNGIPRKENGKIDFTPRKHHGFTTLIIILGFLVPPLAVLVRFGVGFDFFLNILLTIAGYIPGHLHNWFIPNVRNNDNKARTPKWARRYGLVDETGYKRKEKRAWVGRYQDRTPHRTMYDEEGNAFRVEHGEDGLAPPGERVERPDYAAIDAAGSQGRKSRFPFRSSKDRHAVSATYAEERDVYSPAESLDVERPEDPERTVFPDAATPERQDSAPKDPLEYQHQF